MSAGSDRPTKAILLVAALVMLVVVVMVDSVVCMQKRGREGSVTRQSIEEEVRAVSEGVLHPARTRARQQQREEEEDEEEKERRLEALEAAYSDEWIDHLPITDDWLNDWSTRDPLYESTPLSQNTIV
ncbi:hypothetical protein GOP47_0003481 [Adiantum capillus-veneris]|uniref:Transmembrane protein n=1 Tax=Adiantum capillus-veneris TaxID=13818 RepID=A0A9D4ZQ69_ADICA|nr:hypothetical protein GOP47_0003481 [Adiantum capillus-veneris]